ncbi:MAG: acyl-CoA dehydrogenase [Deltaproteobacteria bacterium]|nr:MAG: acyl-CoA dehydrogenase [Deltaproteobacteria bacterium]
MTDLDKFRKETREWLEANCPPSMRWAEQPSGNQALADDLVWGGRKQEYPNPEAKLWLDRMAERGWTAPTWPREYGGGGLSKEEAKILAEEMAALRIKPPLIGFGLTMIGPLLVAHGTEEQKRRFLPPICRGEIRWCQGYSEPGAGSDLASLKTSAVLDGDEWVLNGQKVWTSYADKSDWMFILVRTDPKAPKHAGISFMLFDMETPGVSVRPIRLISGASPFCETFLENVRVPKDQVVGGVGNGWAMAKALLGHERSMISEAFSERRDRNQLVDLARQYLPSEDGRIGDRVVRDQIARLTMNKVCLDLTIARMKEAAKLGQQPGPEASILKYYATELNKDRHSLMISILGPQALGWEGPGFEQEEIDLTRAWLRSRGNSIEGGTSEIQLNIIAKRVLGLPD